MHKLYDCYVVYPNIVSCDVSTSNTSESRNQLATIKKFKWSRTYEIQNYLKFDTKKDQLHEFIIYLNSFTKEFMGEIKFSQNGQDIIKIFLPDKTLADHKIKSKFFIYILSTSDNHITVSTNNLHFDKIISVSLTKNPFLLKLKKYTMTIPSLKKYYQSLNEKLLNIPSTKPVRKTLDRGNSDNHKKIKKSCPRIIHKSCR